jgi:hypothetical protein
MHITLYHRSYAVAGAPVALSFVPDPIAQRHTFTADGRVYEAERRELQIIVPDNAKLDLVKKLLDWVGAEGPVKSKAKEVYDLAEARASGFRMAQ